MRTALVLDVLLVTTAGADPTDRPALDARGYLTVDGASSLDRGELSFGLGALDWTHDGATSIDHMTATLAAAVGLPYVELAATQPLAIASGNGPAAMGGLGGSGGQGTGDLGLHAKVGIAHGHGLGLAVIGRVYLPTASGLPAMQPDALATEADVVADARLGRLRLGVDAGAHWSSGTRTIPLGVGAAFAVTPSFELVGEVTGTVGLATAHAEALGGIKLYLAKSSYLTLAAGRGIDTGDTHAVIGIVFEPRPAARIATEPAPPAPTPDDNDHLVDKDPPPPIEELDVASIVDSKIDPLAPIQFEFDKAVILPESFHVLDAVVRAMQNNPSITKVEVGGHTDERGDDAYNLDLSARRAAAVVDYLVDHGIARERLDSQGYGKTRPIDAAHTEAAWATNRRVEFVIVH